MVKCITIICVFPHRSWMKSSLKSLSKAKGSSNSTYTWSIVCTLQEGRNNLKQKWDSMLSFHQSLQTVSKAGEEVDLELAFYFDPQSGPWGDPGDRTQPLHCAAALVSIAWLLPPLHLSPINRPPAHTLSACWIYGQAECPHPANYCWSRGPAALHCVHHNITAPVCACSGLGTPHTHTHTEASTVTWRQINECCTLTNTRNRVITLDRQTAQAGGVKPCVGHCLYQTLYWLVVRTNILYWPLWIPKLIYIYITTTLVFF